MKIPTNIEFGKLREDLMILCRQRVKDGTSFHEGWLRSRDNIDAYLVFFLGQLSKPTGRYKDAYGWTRIHSRILNQITPFYAVINTHLIDEGIIESVEGGWTGSPDILSRRKGYRLTQKYAFADTKTVNYDPHLLRTLLLGTRYDHVDDTGRVSITIHQLGSFDDDEVESFLESTFRPVYTPLNPPVPFPFDPNDPDYQFTPEELKQHFLEFVEDIISIDLPYEQKKAEIREASDNYEVVVTEQEIESMLEPSERERKAQWVETLKRFEQKNEQKKGLARGPSLPVRVGRVPREPGQQSSPGHQKLHRRGARDGYLRNPVNRVNPVKKIPLPPNSVNLEDLEIWSCFPFRQFRSFRQKFRRRS